MKEIEIEKERNADGKHSERARANYYKTGERVTLSNAQ